MRKVRALAAAVGIALRADTAALIALVVLLLTFPLMGLAAAFDLELLLALGLLVSHLVDGYAVARLPRLFGELESAWLGGFPRQLLRDAAVVLFLARTDRPVSLLSGGLLLVYLLVGAGLLGRALLRRLRALPIQTRNVDVSRLRIPPAPPAALFAPAGVVLSLAVAPAEVGALIAGPAGRDRPLLAGVLISVALAAVGLLAVAAQVVRNRGLRNRGRLFRDTLALLAAPGPQVVLYHSGGPGTAYQVNMWLPALAALPRPVVVVLRQPERLAELVPTDLPVAVVTSASDVMDLVIPTAKVALYPANVGDNLHLIRQPGLLHVFVGHGDSDKATSATRTSRIYDKIWVAGPAGRERYRTAGIGIADGDIVEVGRPQLAGLMLARDPLPEVLTVLYAPTWEGWSADMNVTSVPAMGVRLVQAVLAAGPRVRLLYKPHPLAGVRSPAMRAAHRQIVRLITRTNTERGAHRPGGHAAIEASGPDLYSCFNAADVLVTDISSVLSDFSATGKPYLVTNPANVPAARFTAENPAAAGGYILDADCAALPDLLAGLRRGVDPMRGARDAARHRLLGPDDDDPAARFRAAIAAVVEPGPPRANRTTVLSTAAASAAGPVESAS
jgi:hypothetical protein